MLDRVKLLQYSNFEYGFFLFQKLVKFELSSAQIWPLLTLYVPNLPKPSHFCPKRTFVALRGIEQLVYHLTCRLK